MREIESLAVEDEARLPRATRDLFQRSDADVTQLDTPWSHSVVRVGRINSDGSFVL